MHEVDSLKTKRKYACAKNQQIQKPKKHHSCFFVVYICAPSLVNINLLLRLYHSMLISIILCTMSHGGLMLTSVFLCTVTPGGPVTTSEDSVENVPTAYTDFSAVLQNPQTGRVIENRGTITDNEVPLHQTGEAIVDGAEVNSVSEQISPLDMNTETLDMDWEFTVPVEASNEQAGDGVFGNTPEIAMLNDIQNYNASDDPTGAMEVPTQETLVNFVTGQTSVVRNGDTKDASVRTDVAATNDIPFCTFKGGKCEIHCVVIEFCTCEDDDDEVVNPEEFMPKEKNNVDKMSATTSRHGDQKVIVLSDDEKDTPVMSPKPRFDIDDPSMYENPCLFNGKGNLDEAKRDNKVEKHLNGGSTSATIPGTQGAVTLFESEVGSITYSPLQKWEYERGLPVNGVTDVKKWAILVGLAEDIYNSPAEDKEGKIDVHSAPSKYGGTSHPTLDGENDVEGTKEGEENLNVGEGSTTQPGPVDKKGKKPIEEN